MDFASLLTHNRYDKRKPAPTGAELKKKRLAMQRIPVIAAVGLIGGIASYITNNMGPMLNVYLLALQLDPYSLVGT